MDTNYNISNNNTIVPMNNRTGIDTETEIVSSYIKNYVGIDTSPGPWIVWWQYAPVIMDTYFVNFNRLSWKGFVHESESVLRGKVTMSSPFTFDSGIDYQSTRDYNFNNQLLQASNRKDGYEFGEPLGYIHYPIFDKLDTDNPKVVAILTATVYWKGYFEGILSSHLAGMLVSYKISRSF
jgi:hypothetical protein